MKATEARVPTERADRYLAQLCDHLGHMQQGAVRHEPAAGGGHDGHGGPGGPGGHAAPAEVRTVDRADGHAAIEFDWGRCELTASPRELVVQLRAVDAEALARGRELLARRIETIGRREQLEVTWQPLDEG